jgi:hypothetical protein
MLKTFQDGALVLDQLKLYPETSAIAPITETLD